MQIAQQDSVGEFLLVHSCLRPYLPKLKRAMSAVVTEARNKSPHPPTHPFPHVDPA